MANPNCLACRGMGGWYDGDEGQWVECLCIRANLADQAKITGIGIYVGPTTTITGLNNYPTRLSEPEVDSPVIVEKK